VGGVPDSEMEDVLLDQALSLLGVAFYDPAKVFSSLMQLTYNPNFACPNPLRYQQRLLRNAYNVCSNRREITQLMKQTMTVLLWF